MRINSKNLSFVLKNGYVLSVFPSGPSDNVSTNNSTLSLLFRKTRMPITKVLALMVERNSVSVNEETTKASV